MQETFHQEIALYRLTAGYGILGIADPIKETTPIAIEALHRLGVEVTVFVER